MDVDGFVAAVRYMLVGYALLLTALLLTQLAVELGEGWPGWRLGAALVSVVLAWTALVLELAGFTAVFTAGFA